LIGRGHWIARGNAQLRVWLPRGQTVGARPLSDFVIKLDMEKSTISSCRNVTLGGCDALVGGALEKGNSGASPVDRLSAVHNISPLAHDTHSCLERRLLSSQSLLEMQISENTRQSVKAVHRKNSRGPVARRAPRWARPRVRLLLLMAAWSLGM
jgi:hypothetical protein